KECREKGDLNPFELVEGDVVLQKGTGEYWKELPETKTKLK
ncbi:MAG: phenylalanine 4-monooxygenase, partial [Proteobacteria bacterium]|nr:phenylalanine 4-monooxygenase [Pseudomonadota bacterium]